MLCNVCEWQVIISRDELSSLRARNAELEAKLSTLVEVLRWLDIQGGLGYEKHDRIKQAIAAAKVN